MRIHEIPAVELYGATPEGGWNNELRPEDSVHTLMAVSTDEGLTGLMVVKGGRISTGLIPVSVSMCNLSESAFATVV